MRALTQYWALTVRFLKIIWWATKFQFQAIGWWAALRLVRQGYYSVSSIIYGYWFGQLINVLVNAYENGLHLPERQRLQVILMWIISLALVELLIGLNEGLLNALQQQHFLVEYFKKIYKQIGFLDWPQIENPKTEKLLRSVMDQGFWPLNAVLNRIVALITTFITFGVALRLMHLPPIVIAIIILTVIPKGIVDFYFVLIDGKVYGKILPSLVRSGGITGYFRNFNTIYESKIWRSIDYMIGRFSTERSSYENNLRADTRWYRWINIFTSIISFGGGITVLLYLLREVLLRTLQVGTFQFYYTTLQQVRSDILMVFGNIGELADAYRYLGYAYDFFQLERMAPDGTITLKPDHIPSIEFRQVWFKYPHSKKWALRDVSVTIKPYERLALVGENGAGKSTFLRLLTRSYRPTRGEILIDGVNLNDINLDSWYRLLALITQDFARFDMLEVGENIRLQTKKKNQEKALRQAAKLAEAHEFIEHLPQKYQTVLSKRIEGGTELSTGQWQKVALSRLFYANKPVVILDEPTAAIDPVSEARIFKNIYRLLKKKTVVLVSHRYNTVQSAHNILVFVNGRVVEQGTHETLLAQNGYYAEAYRLQQSKKEL